MAFRSMDQRGSMAMPERKQASEPEVLSDVQSSQQDDVGFALVQCFADPFAVIDTLRKVGADEVDDQKVFLCSLRIAQEYMLHGGSAGKRSQEFRQFFRLRMAFRNKDLCVHHLDFYCKLGRKINVANQGLMYRTITECKI